MNISKGRLSLVLLAFALAACDGSDGKDTPGTTPEPAEDAGVVNAPIPLELWVDDLVEHHSGDEALPDTVDDKNIKDNEDPTLFDKYFDATP